MAGFGARCSFDCGLVHHQHHPCPRWRGCAQYPVFVPFALAGWQLGRVGIQPALATLALAFLRLTLTAVLMVISLWVLRIKPKGSNGWLIFAIC